MAAHLVPRTNDQPTVGRRCFLVMIAVLFATVRAASALEGGGELLEPGAGAVVRGGDAVEVRWTKLPHGVDEFEVLLSVDGGRTFPLRLTAMMDPGLTSYVWRVPNLPSGTARLRLRVGVDGREEMLAAGPEFEVAGDAGEPTGRITFRGGEWWPTEGVATEPHVVEVAPRWSEREPDGERTATAAAFPPPHPEQGVRQAATRWGNDGPPWRLLCPAAPVREQPAARAFPKRE